VRKRRPSGEERRAQIIAVTLDLVMPEFNGLHALHGIMQIMAHPNKSARQQR